MNHRGLHKPQTSNKQLAASASRHARMLRNGTTPGVRSIGGKFLAKYRQGLGLPAVELPEFLNVLEARIVLIQSIMAKYAKMGGNTKIINRFLTDLRTLVENKERVINVKIENNTPYLNGVPYQVFTGLALPFDLSALGNLFGGSGDQTAPGDPSGNNGSGTNFSDFSGGGSGSSDGFDVSSLLDAAGNIDFGNIGDTLGNLFGGGTGACGIKFHNNRQVGDSFFHGSEITMKYKDADYVLKQFGGGLESFGWRKNHCPSSGAQGIFKRAEDRFWQILPQFFDKVLSGQAQLPNTWKDDAIVRAYLGPKIDEIVAQQEAAQAAQQAAQNAANNGGSQNFNNQNPANQNPPQKTGISTTTAVAGGFGLLGLIGLGMWYFGQQNDAPKKSKKA